MLLDEEFIDWLYEKLNAFLELAKEQNDELIDAFFMYNKKVVSLNYLILEILSIIEHIRNDDTNDGTDLNERNACVSEICYIWSLICTSMWL